MQDLGAAAACQKHGTEKYQGERIPCPGKAGKPSPERATTFAQPGCVLSPIDPVPTTCECPETSMGYRKLLARPVWEVRKPFLFVSVF